MKQPKDYLHNVKDSDVISGAMWRKFIADYKKYDAKQKELITELYGQIYSLSKQLEAMEDCPTEVAEFRAKWKQRTKEHNIVCQRLHEARIEIESLQSKLATQTL